MCPRENCNFAKLICIKLTQIFFAQPANAIKSRFFLARKGDVILKKVLTKKENY